MSSYEESDDDDTCWISSILQSPFGEFLCRVDDDYIKDKFNLTYLEREVSNFRKSNEIILGISYDENCQESAIKLYGLIHARFILTPMGQSKMFAKYKEGCFGICPRVLCSSSHLLPIGVSDRPDQNTVKLFCPKCQDVYEPKSRRLASVDGAWFGTSFPHFLIQTYKDYFPREEKIMYTPRVFGFKLAQY